jgi:hypothetical protein
LALKISSNFFAGGLTLVVADSFSGCMLITSVTNLDTGRSSGLWQLQSISVRLNAIAVTARGFLQIGLLLHTVTTSNNVMLNEAAPQS